MTIAVVRGHVELVYLCQVADLLGLAEPIPGHVHHEHVGGVQRKVGEVLPHGEEAFAGAELCGTQ